MHVFCAYLHTQLESKRSYKDALPIKQLLYYQRYLFTGLEMYARYNWQTVDPNTHRYLFLRRNIVRPYTDNSTTTGHIWMFYILNDYSTIGDVYFLCLSWMQGMIDKL